MVLRNFKDNLMYIKIISYRIVKDGIDFGLILLIFVIVIFGFGFLFNIDVCLIVECI